MRQSPVALFVAALVVAGILAWLVLSGGGPPASDVEIEEAGASARERAPAIPPPDEDEPEGGEVAAAAGAREPAREEGISEGAVLPPDDRPSSPAAEFAYGVVVDPSGAPLAGVDVHASVPGFRGIGGTVVATATTDRDGAFSFGIPRQREAVRIDFVKEGYRVERREGPFRDLHVVLAPLRATAIEGRLVDPAGRPLAPDDLAFLFGEFGPDAPPPPPFLEPSAVLAVPDRSLGQSDVERPADVADDARFTIPRPPFFAGEVVLVFRGLVLARRSWQEGDPPVVFEVDVAALRRALGRLEVTLEGTSTIPAAEEVEIDVRRRSPITRREEAETFVVEPPETLVVEGLPAGRYRVVARSPLAYGRTEATVPSGGTGRANVLLSGPAQVRIRLAWSDGEPMQASEVHLVRRDPSGSPQDLEQTARDVDGGVLVSVEAPAGPGSFSFDGNVLPVDLEPGMNTDLDWTLERSRRVVLSIQVTAPSRADRPREAEAQVTLRAARGGTAVADRPRVAVKSDGVADVVVDVPPGRYLMDVDFAELRRVEATLDVDSSDEQRFEFPLD